MRQVVSPTADALIGARVVAVYGGGTSPAGSSPTHPHKIWQQGPEASNSPVASGSPTLSGHGSPMQLSPAGAGNVSSARTPPTATAPPPAQGMGAMNGVNVVPGKVFHHSRSRSEGWNPGLGLIGPPPPGMHTLAPPQPQQQQRMVRQQQSPTTSPVPPAATAARAVAPPPVTTVFPGQVSPHGASTNTTAGSAMRPTNSLPDSASSVASPLTSSCKPSGTVSALSLQDMAASAAAAQQKQQQQQQMMAMQGHAGQLQQSQQQPQQQQQQKKSPSPTPSPTATVDELPSPHDKLPKVTIQGRTYQLGDVLGKGSFGTVWKARELGQRDFEVAVKDIICRNDKERQQAEYEAALMKRLTNSLGQAACQKLNQKLRLACPKLHANHTVMEPSGMWKVTIAMERVSGIPLDEHTRERKRKLDFWESSRLSMELLQQLLPTMEHLAGHCVHRDINAHNILLAPCTDKEANRFTLIDFGLAAEVSSWRAGDWKTKDIGGDCRYWPVSCWQLFLFGFKYLLGSKTWTNEYVYGLDHHALVLTCVQLLVEVGRGQFPEQVADLEKAWLAYWDVAMKFWQQLYTCFKQQGNWNALKKAFLQQDVAEATGRNLTALRSALSKSARFASSAATAGKPGTDELVAFFSTLARMMDDDVVPWRELQMQLASKPVAVTSSSMPGTSSAVPGRSSTSGVSGAGGASSSTSSVTAVAAGPATGSGNSLSSAAVAPATASPTTTSPTSSSAIPVQGGAAAGGLAAGDPPKRRFTHARVRTLDGASSITRGVPEVRPARFPADEHLHQQQCRQASSVLAGGAGGAVAARNDGTPDVASAQHPHTAINGYAEKGAEFASYLDKNTSRVVSLGTSHRPPPWKEGAGNAIKEHEHESDSDSHSDSDTNSDDEA